MKKESINLFINRYIYINSSIEICHTMSEIQTIHMTDMCSTNETTQQMLISNDEIVQQINNFTNESSDQNNENNQFDSENCSENCSDIENDDAMSDGEYSDAMSDSYNEVAILIDNTPTPSNQGNCINDSKNSEENDILNAPYLFIGDESIQSSGNYNLNIHYHQSNNAQVNAILPISANDALNNIAKMSD